MSRRFEEKQRAARYFHENQVPKQLETLLNEMFHKQPDDIYGYMAEYFGALSKPAAISEIKLEPVLSSFGYQTIKSTISCIVNGVSKEICQVQHFNDDRPPAQKLATVRSSAKQSKKDGGGGGGKGKNTKKDPAPNTEEAIVEAPLFPKYNFNVNNALTRMNEMIPHLIGCSLETKTIDERLQQLTEQMKNDKLNELQQELNPPSPVEVEGGIGGEEGAVQISIIPSPSSEQTTEQPLKTCVSAKDIMEINTELNASSFFLSFLSAASKSRLMGDPLYEQFLSSAKKENLTIPMPAITFFSCCQVTPGKVNMVRELMVLFKPNADFKEGVEQVIKLYHAFEKALQAKYGATGIIKDSRGVLTPTFDKVEQIFEVLTQTCRAEFEEREFKDLFDIILDVGANEFFDPEKKKYELCIGSMKSTDEVVALYQSWIEQFSIVAFVDPFSTLDPSKKTVYDSLATQCYIISSQVSGFEQCHLEMDERTIDGMLLKPEVHSSTVSETVENLLPLHEKDGILMMNDEWGLVQHSTASVDLSIVFGATFIRVTTPCGVGSNSLQYMLDIKESLPVDNESFDDERSYIFRSKVPDEEAAVQAPVE